MAGAEIPPVRLRSGQAIARDDRAWPVFAKARICDQMIKGKPALPVNFAPAFTLHPSTHPIHHPPIHPPNPPSIHSDASPTAIIDDVSDRGRALVASTLL
jgi:hypothetical protein